MHWGCTAMLVERSALADLHIFTRRQHLTGPCSMIRANASVSDEVGVTPYMLSRDSPPSRYFLYRARRAYCSVVGLQTGLEANFLYKNSWSSHPYHYITALAVCKNQFNSSTINCSITSKRSDAKANDVTLLGRNGLWVQHQALCKNCTHQKQQRKVGQFVSGYQQPGLL